MKTDIKLRVTPEQSEAVQQICFANDIGWGFEGKYKDIKHLEQSLLFIYDKNITFAYYDNDYFVNNKNKEIDADLFIRTNGTCEESIDAVKDLLDYQSKEDMFKQYGFEVPDFECEIWKVETSISFEYVHGLVLNDYAHPMGNLKYHKWKKWNGEVLIGCSSKNLNPIKRPWYETCKFPVLVWDADSHLYPIQTRGEYTASYLDMCKPLSNEEIDQLKQDF